MAQRYLRPDNLDDALTALADGDFVRAAGCTDLLAATELKVLPGDILDLTGISALRGISTSKGGFRIGGGTTWTDIIRADLPAAFDGLKLAAREVGSIQIQNRGTIAGNLCNASPAADGVPPLLTLDAVVELTSVRGARTLPLADFITGPRQIALAADEVLTAVLIPEAATRGASHFLKLGARKYLVISIAMTAARIAMKDGVVTDAALSVGACGPVATRLEAAETALIGAPLDPSRITDAMVEDALSPIDDVRADAGYRRTSAAELVRRTLIELAAPTEVAA